MKPSEALLLLATIARTDKRTAGESEARSWADLMTKADVSLTDAIDAVQHHFGTSHDYLMPIHIIDRVKEVRRERIQAAGTPPIPGDLTWQQERAWRQLWCANVKDGMTPDSAAAAASEALNLPKELPPGTSEAVAEERKALVQKLADSKAAPKARPEDHQPRPRKPRTRWGCWARGTYVPNNGDTHGHIRFHPDGHALYHEGGPYGIELDELGGDLRFWLNHMADKGCDAPCLIALTEAFIHIFDTAPDVPHTILEQVRATLTTHPGHQPNGEQ